MKPCRAMNNRPDGALSDAILRCNGASCLTWPFIANFLGYFPCNSRIVHSFHACIASIIRHITKPQMIWVNTKRIISTRAIMQNPHSVWNCSVVNNPTGDVSSDLSPRFWTTAYCSPSVSASSPNPQPATSGLVNLYPESLPERNVKTLRKCGILWDCLFRHKSVRLICATAPRRFVHDAGAILCNY